MQPNSRTDADEAEGSPGSPNPVTCVVSFTGHKSCQCTDSGSAPCLVRSGRVGAAPACGTEVGESPAGHLGNPVLILGIRNGGRNSLCLGPGDRLVPVLGSFRSLPFRVLRSAPCSESANRLKFCGTGRDFYGPRLSGLAGTRRPPALATILWRTVGSVHSQTKGTQRPSNIGAGPRPRPGYRISARMGDAQDSAPDAGFPNPRSVSKDASGEPPAYAKDS